MSSGGKFGMSDLGLRLPPGLDFEEWERLGTKLGRLASATTWNVADWALYGVENFSRETTTRAHHASAVLKSSRYQKALELTGFSYGHLVMLASVARRVPHERRRPELSFSHHDKVAALPAREQAALLEQACEQGWSSRRLAEAVGAVERLDERRLRGTGGRTRAIAESEASSGSRPTPAFVVRPTASQASRWAAAAAAVELDVEHWLSRIADEATCAVAAAA